MADKNSRHTRLWPLFASLLVATVFLAVGLPSRVLADIALDDENTAALYGDELIPVKTTFGRTPRLVSEVAENVTVITREDIARLQAQTLDDVLQYYSGVLPYPGRMPGDLSVPVVQGLPNRQCLVTLDGIPLNNLSDGVIDIGIMPVGFLERIEIVKGPAASVWGRSVGAVINLVTQEPEPDRPFSGRITGSLGSRNSGYGDVNLSGSSKETGSGYFLAASGHETKGFQKGIDGNGRGVYAKLTQKVGQKTDLSMLFGRSAVDRNLLYLPQGPPLPVRAENDGAAYFGISRVQHKLSSNVEIEAALYLYNLAVDNSVFNLAPVPPFLPVAGIKVQAQGVREETEGLQVAYKRNTSRYWLTVGVDATTSSLRNSDRSLAPPPKNSRTVSHPYSVAEYASGGYNLTPDLAMTASLRYDWYSQLDDTWSPNIGLIYKLDQQTVLRASYGYGYSLPTLSSGSSGFETLWRVQVGAETNHLPGVWLKTNAFYDRTSNVKLNLKFFDLGPEVNRNLTREGFEIEARTMPLFNISFGLGYTYTHIFNSDSGSDLAGMPRHHLLLSADYRLHGTDLMLVGRYVNWNSPAASDSLVWDLLLTQKMHSWDSGSISLKFGVHNIFSGSQYATPLFPNAPLRVDAGLQVLF